MKMAIAKLAASMLIMSILAGCSQYSGHDCKAISYAIYSDDLDSLEVPDRLLAISIRREVDRASYYFADREYFSAYALCRAVEQGNASQEFRGNSE